MTAFDPPPFPRLGRRRRRPAASSRMRDPAPGGGRLRGRPALPDGRRDSRRISGECDLARPRQGGPRRTEVEARRSFAARAGPARGRGGGPAPAARVGRPRRARPGRRRSTSESPRPRTGWRWKGSASLMATSSRSTRISPIATRPMWWPRIPAPSSKSPISSTAAMRSPTPPIQRPISPGSKLMPERSTARPSGLRTTAISAWSRPISCSTRP